jgi:ABC-2 type transport system ATP-binding protein
MQLQESVIQIEHLSRRYGQKLALDDVTFAIPRGIVLGLVGANGAGKTTLIKHVLGLLRAEQGQVRVFGLDPVTQAVEVLSRLGFLSEDRDMPPWMTVGELMRYTKAFYPGWDSGYAEALREQFQLPARSRIRTLSKGELAKAGLLMALAHRPELLVLDEPSSGLDPLVRRELLEAVVRSVAEEGRTVLFSSHLLDEIARVSDAVAMVVRGKLVLQGPLHQVLETHHRVVVRLPKSGPLPPRFPGVLSVSGGPEEWTMICHGSDAGMRGAMGQVGGEVLEESEVSFEDIFHAHAIQSPPETSRPVAAQ